MAARPLPSPEDPVVHGGHIVSQRPLLILVLVLFLPMSACSQPQSDSGPAAAAVAATAAAESFPTAAAGPPAPTLVTGLPDFTRLVDATAPAVVNIEAGPAREREVARRGAGEGEGQEGRDIGELFDRFFGEPRRGDPRRPGSPFGGGGGVSFGSGFIISADGYILTNHHVIADAEEVIVHLADRRELVAEVVGSDPLSDVALLKVQASGLPVLRIGDSRNLKPGQWVIAIGSPFGYDHSVTAGIVSGIGRRSLDPTQQYVPFIQTDVAINRGNSGGPLLNVGGEVVGINSQIFSNSGGYMGVSFAIPVEVAMNAANQLRQTGRVVRGQLGVQIGDVDRERAEELGLARTGGAFVASVQNGSSAERAGVRPGDVILAFNGREIGSSSELPPMVGALAPGSRAKLRVFRDGRTLELEAELMALDAGEVTGESSSPFQGEGGDSGIEVAALSARERASLDLASNEGVRITGVRLREAQAAGLAEGDLILRVGRTPVATPEQFQQAMAAYESGDSVRLLVRNERNTGFVVFVLP
jgi:serine protease Do